MSRGTTCPRPRLAELTDRGLGGLFDPDAPWCRYRRLTYPLQSRESWLDYAALFGFYHFITFLVVEYSQDVNATDSDYNQTPSHVSLTGGHVVFVVVQVVHAGQDGTRDKTKRISPQLLPQGEEQRRTEALLQHLVPRTGRTD